MIKLQSLARKKKPGAPMEELFSARVSVDEGLHGDHRGKPGKRQVTVLSRESWLRACEEVGEDLSWLTRRANLLIRGFEFLPTDIGKFIHIGDVILEITGETGPCNRMEQQQAGLYEALLSGWRGGVCCIVVQGGSLQSGDDASIVD